MRFVADTISTAWRTTYAPSDTLLPVKSCSLQDSVSGLMGDALPYSPRTDNGIALVLLFCFVLTALTLARSKKLLSEMMKGFLRHRERASLFAIPTSGEMRFLLLLLGQTCVLSGLCIFNYFNDVNPRLMAEVPPHLVLGIYIVICLLYLFFKWLIYSFLGWIFFDKIKVSLWIESYFSLTYCIGFALFPFVLLLVYFDLSLAFFVTFALVFVIFTKILMIYKWIKLFFDNIFGLFLLILYFCALEIMPCFIVYQGMIELNELLVIKF